MPFTAGSQNMRFLRPASDVDPARQQQCALLYASAAEPGAARPVPWDCVRATGDAASEPRRQCRAEQRCRLAAFRFAVWPVRGFAGKSAQGESKQWGGYGPGTAQRSASSASKADGSASALRRVVAPPVQLRRRPRLVRMFVPVRVIKRSVSLHRGAVDGRSLYGSLRRSCANGRVIMRRVRVRRTTQSSAEFAEIQCASPAECAGSAGQRRWLSPRKRRRVALRGAIPVEVTATADGKKGFVVSEHQFSSHGPDPFQRGSGRFFDWGGSGSFSSFSIKKLT